MYIVQYTQWKFSNSVNIQVRVVQNGSSTILTRLSSVDDQSMLFSRQNADNSIKRCFLSIKLSADQQPILTMSTKLFQIKAFYAKFSYDFCPELLLVISFKFIIKACR